MDQKRKNKPTRRERFFAKHPWCCFCGGQKPATTRDHVPARIIFDNNRSPRGYVFPACEACNQRTKSDEQVVAMLSRLLPDSYGEEQQREFVKILKGIRRNNPGILESLEPSTREKRRWMRQWGIGKHPYIAPSKMPVLKLDKAHPNIRLFGRKLFCALHYRHTGRVVPPNGYIWVYWKTNVQIALGRLPAEALKHITIKPDIKWNNVDLSDQFYYQFAVSEEGDIGGYVAQFRRSYVLVGLVSFECPSETPTDEAMHPLSAV